MELEGCLRKPRVTKKQMWDFGQWAVDNDVFKHYTAGRIQQLYKEHSGIMLSQCCIRKQKNRWVMIDGKLYDRNHEESMP